MLWFGTGALKLGLLLALLLETSRVDVLVTNMALVLQMFL